MELKNFQFNTVLAIKEAMNNSKKEIVLKSPTGSGKTLMLTYFMDDYCKSFPKTVFVWFTPGKGNLEEQSKRKMDQYFPNSSTKLIGDVMTSGFEENDCCFINWEMLTNKTNNAMKDGERKNFKEHVETAIENGIRFVIIVDESHQNDSIKAKEVLDKTDLDEKLFDAVDKAQDKAKEVLDKTDIDEKIMDAANQVKDRAEDVVSDLKDKVSK